MLYDDGWHADGKSDDGVYANSFKNTAASGIYKFYFQLSGRNNRAGEPFIRECFLAKTVKPAPTPTPAVVPDTKSRACKGRIVASKPVMVGPTDVGGSNSSEYGRYSIDASAVGTSAGILVTWQMDSNAYMRLLDDNLKPISDVKLLFERNTNDIFGAVRTDLGEVLSYCGRYERNNFLTSAFLDPSGHLLKEIVWSPTDPPGCNTTMQAAWTGSHLMFVWDVSDPWPAPLLSSTLHFAITDANGNLLAERKTHLDGWGGPYLAVGHGRVLLVVWIRDANGRTQLAVHRFDLAGNELGEPVILDPLIYEDNGKIVTGSFSSTFMILTADGWTLFAPSETSTVYVAQFNSDGSALTSNPTMVDTDSVFLNDLPDKLPYEDGALFQARMQAYPLGIGIVTQDWLPEEHEQPLRGFFFEHQGRLFLVYRTETNSKPATNEVLIRELKCVP